MKISTEVITIHSVNISVDISLLEKTEDLFFSATDMAKPFGKIPVEWLRLPETEEYVEAFLNMGLSHIKKFDDLVKTKRGRYNGGTWLHHELGLAFARWLSPTFAVRLDLWTRERFKKEMRCRESRLTVKTGYLPMTKAIVDSHEDPKFYHFSNENNLLYSIILGMSAKAYKELNGVESVRENLTLEQLVQLSELQFLNTALIMMNQSYKSRKDTLRAFCENKGFPMLMQKNSCTGGETVFRDDCSGTPMVQDSGMQIAPIGV